MRSKPWLPSEAARAAHRTAPHLVSATDEGLYAAQCLKCGLVGPERKDSLKAKLAFDQRWHELSLG